jgi:uncharacterized protein
MPRALSNSVRVIYPPFNRNELVERLQRGVTALSQELPVKRSVLFGSWAADRATAFSDIDLLVVYEGPSREDAFGVVRRHIPIKGLEPHVYTEDEALAVGETLARMTRGGVDLLT